MLNFEYLGNYPNGKETRWSNKCQGVTHDADHWYITQTLQIWKIPASADLDFSEKTPESQVLLLPEHLQRAGYNHFGDLDYWEGYLFISLENKSKSKPPAIILWDAKNFKYFSGAILPSPNKKDIPWCAIHPLEGTIFTSDFKCKSELFEYDFSISKNKKFELKFLRKILLKDQQEKPINIKRVQGGVFSKKNKLLYISSDGRKKGGIYIFETEGYTLVEHIKVPYDPGFPNIQEVEGITLWNLDAPLINGIKKPDKINGQLHLIILDNDLCNDDIYFKHFRIPSESNR